MKEIALEFCEETLKLKDTIEKNFLELGARLFKIRNEELYKGQYESYPLFLEELKISESVASRLVTVWRMFVDDYGLSQEKLLKIGWSDLYQISQVAKDVEQAEEWVEKGLVLSSGDLRTEIAETKTGKPQKECSHPRIYTMKVCPDCHYKEKIYEDD